MVPSLNPKKKNLMPSGALRSKLRGAGHALSPIVQIGKEGTTEAVVKQLGQALRDHELVKVKIGSECPESRFEVAENLATQSGAGLAQILGRTVLVYKRDPVKSRFEGGGTATAAAGGGRAQAGKTLRKKSATSPKR